MKGRPISKKSKEIIKLVNKGECFSAIVAKGYARDTVKYYIRKIKKPRKYKKFIKTISKYNQIRLKTLQKTKNVL
jgi:hypothetical protein